MNRIIFIAPLLLAACGQPAPPTAPLAGARIGGPFSLTDQDGASVTDKSFAGKYRVMYFGYTFCPDICPTDVANLARGIKAFAATDPARAARVRFIFISVDPARDTGDALKSFSTAFATPLVALTGTSKAIEEMAKAYGVAYSIAPGQPKDAYLVDHSRVAYLMSPDNKPIALLPQDGTPQDIARELGLWVK